MIALSLTLAYVASLAFGAFLLWRRDRYRENVRDALVNLGVRVGATEHVLKQARPKWDAAADYVEAQQMQRGMTRAGR